jgi:hypothetical protein
VTPAFRQSQLLRAAAAAALFGAASVANAAGQFIEDIQVSRNGPTATIRFDLACPMRFQSDFAAVESVLLEIRVAPLESCHQLGVDGGVSEIHRPVGAHLAHLVEVEYESLGLGENLLVLKFDRPVEYRVTQRGDLRSIELVVRREDGAPSVVPSESPPRAAPSAPPQELRPARPIPSDRAPLVARTRAPDAPADYVINLQSTREPADPTLIESVPVQSPLRLYVSETEVDGVQWHRLRLGFFASEQEARAALAPLVERFPRAWVGRADAEEVVSAGHFAERSGGIVRAAAARERAQAEVADVGETLAPEQAAALLAEGRDALLAADFDRAIRTYARVLAMPGEHGAEAREYLGLARERNMQPEYARAEYQQYLRDFPDGEGAARVRQRLNGLVTTAETPRAALTSVEDERRWDVATGVSQYYRRAVDRFDQDRPEVVSLSALLSDVDLSIRRTGAALDLSGRVTVNHQHDLIGASVGGPGDRSRISYAYLDVDSQRDWSLRVGRQTLRSSGVLGRFDGAHATYELAERRRLHFATGYPVESTRDSIKTGRQFYGVAVDFDELIGVWDFITFVNQQTIEGINDREAVGLEVRYADERRSLTSLLDYDVGYSELNTALALGTWRFPNRMILTALVDVRMGPVLTTRNALIGQPVETIEELMLVWTEDEIRQIARDRTAPSRTATLGVAKPLGERFQVNADITRTEIGDTVESVGVAAIPGTDPQTYYSASFVGAGLFRQGDVMIFNLRYGGSDEFAVSQLTWDARFPVGRRLRVNPRLRFGVWDSPLQGRRRESVTPSFRLLLNPARRYWLELEAGTDQFTRTDRASEQQSSGHFLNLGYRADF